MNDSGTRPPPSRLRLLFLLFALAAIVALIAILLPEQLRFIAVIAAFVFGVGLERYRQWRFPRPPSLGETPEAWKYLLRYEVGYGQLAIAFALLAGAAGILFLSFDSSDEPEAPVSTTERTPSAGKMPDVETQRERPGRPFVAGGVKFDVTTTFREEGSRGFLFVDIDVRNQSAKRFNPASLSYRLRAEDGSVAAPTRSNAVGSEALVRSGTLPEKSSVEQQLEFEVGPAFTRAVLEFEPVEDGSLRVSVPVRRDD